VKGAAARAEKEVLERSAPSAHTENWKEQTIKFGRVFEPAEIRRVSFEEVECTARGERFQTAP
jgi:hypothetical protein